MQQMPLSASMRAPASMQNSLLSDSCSHTTVLDTCADAAWQSGHETHMRKTGTSKHRQGDHGVPTMIRSSALCIQWLAEADAYLDNAGCQACCTGGLARGVNSTWQKGGHILQDLGFATGRIAHNSNIDITTQLNALQQAGAGYICIAVLKHLC